MPGEGPPFFIVGSPRSGTGLITSILSAHSKVAVLDETFYFGQVIPRAKPSLRGGDIIDLGRFSRVVRSHPAMEPLFPFIEGGALEGRGPWSVGSFFADLCGRYAESLGKVRWGEKTPSHIWNWKAINRVFPTCQFIVMVRDGRDVVCSLADRPWSSGSKVADAFRWKMETRKGLKLASELGPRRVMHLSYEELVREPTTATKRVCEHLSLPYELSMLSEFRDTGEMTRRREAGLGEDADQRIYTSSIGRHRRDLGARTLASLSSLMGPELSEMGYTVTGGPAPSLAARALIYLLGASAFGRFYLPRRLRYWLS